MPVYGIETSNCGISASLLAQPAGKTHWRGRRIQIFTGKGDKLANVELFPFPCQIVKEPGDGNALSLWFGPERDQRVRVATGLEGGMAENVRLVKRSWRAFTWAR